MKELKTGADLDEALALSATQPILVFKHSLTCGTSAMAHEEVLEQAASAASPVVFLLRIQAARELSRAVEDRLGIRHESPQVLLVMDGRAVWHASHFRVTAAAIAAAVSAFVPADSPA